jgi:hypothetical protein
LCRICVELKFGLGWEKKVVRESSRGVAWNPELPMLQRMNPENGLNVKKEI